MGCSTLLLQLRLTASHFQVAAILQMALLPPQPAWRKGFQIWTHYPWQSAPSAVWDQAAKGRQGSAEPWTLLQFICTKGRDLKQSWGHLRSLLAAPTPSV